jgi:inosose dehydratase
VLDRLAGAPISWGVCEVPGWGHQMRPERVLAEMRAVGLVATEFGPAGFLPRDPEGRAEVLRASGLAAVGGFLPVVLHDPARDPMATVASELDALAAAGADSLVLSADTGGDGYEDHVELDAAGWRALLANLVRIEDAAAERGITATLHPHAGTLVERADAVDRVLEDSDIPLCLDTGHLLIGGADPVAIAASVPERIRHCHLKDVDEAVAARVRSGEISYLDGVRTGLYRPLGRGDVDLAAVVGALEAAGYDGWYVMEQDTVLTAEPPAGDGPVADVRAGLAFLRELAP